MNSMARHCRISGGYYTNTQALTNIFIPLYLACTLSHFRISGGYTTQAITKIFIPLYLACTLLHFRISGGYNTHRLLLIFSFHCIWLTPCRTPGYQADTTHTSHWFFPLLAMPIDSFSFCLQDIWWRLHTF